METNTHLGMATEKTSEFSCGDEGSYLFNGGIRFERFLIIWMKISSFPILQASIKIQPIVLKRVYFDIVENFVQFWLC